MGWKPSDLLEKLKERTQAARERLQAAPEWLKSRPRTSLAIAGIAAISLIGLGLLLTLPRSASDSADAPAEFAPPVVAEDSTVPSELAINNELASQGSSNLSMSGPDQHPSESVAPSAPPVTAPLNQQPVAPVEFTATEGAVPGLEEPATVESSPQLPEAPPGAGQFVFEPADPANGLLEEQTAPEPQVPSLPPAPVGNVMANDLPEPAPGDPAADAHAFPISESEPSVPPEQIVSAPEQGFPGGIQPSLPAAPDPASEQPLPENEGDVASPAEPPATLPLDTTPESNIAMDAGPTFRNAGESPEVAQPSPTGSGTPEVIATPDASPRKPEVGVAPAEYAEPTAPLAPGPQNIPERTSSQAEPQPQPRPAPQPPVVRDNTSEPGEQQQLPAAAPVADQAPLDVTQEPHIAETPVSQGDTTQPQPRAPRTSSPRQHAADQQKPPTEARPGPTPKGAPAYEMDFPEEAPTQVNPALSVQVQGPPEIQPGNSCTYRIVVRNNGTTAAEGVQLVARVAGPVSDVETEPTSHREGEYLVWDLGTVDSSATHTVTVRLKPVGEGEIVVAARVLVAANVASRTRVTQPRLTLVKVGPSQVEKGERVRFLITVSNPGTGTARNVLIRDTMPEGFQHPAGTNLEYEVGDLGPGESRDIPLEVVAVKAGSFTNTAVATADGGLKAQASATVVVTEAALVVEKSGPERRYLGEEATYVIRVRNAGTAPARGVTVVDVLPPGLKLETTPPGANVSRDQRTVTWNAGVLPPGAERVYEVSCTTVRPGEQVNRIVATASGGLKSEAECQTMVLAVPALLLEVIDTDDPLEVGATTTYEVRIVNQGTKPIEGLSVRVEIPEGMEFLAADAPAGFRETEGAVIFDSIPPIAPRASIAFYLRVRGLTPGDKRVRVRVETGPLGVPIVEEESTKVYDGG